MRNIINYSVFGILFLLVAGGALAADTDKARRYFGDHILVDQNQQRHRFYSDLLADHVVLINVVFASCDDACPLQTKTLRRVKRDLGERFDQEIRFLSLSVDPEKDTPETLKQFARQQGVDEPGWYFLDAEPETMRTVLNKLGQWTSQPAQHSTLLIAGNTRTAHWVKIPPASAPERIVYELNQLADE